MLGVICCRPGAGKKRPVRDVLLGMPVWRLEWDPDSLFARRRALRCGRRLVKLGVRRVLLPEGFPFAEQMEAMRLVPVEASGLYAVLAGPLALAVLTGGGEEPCRAGVTLCAVRADDALVQAAHFLCPRVKRLSLCVQQGGERLCSQLYREYGAAVETGGEGLGFRVCFEATDDPKALDVHCPRKRMPGLTLRVPGLELPPDWESDRVLAALWQSGYINPERVEVTWRGK